MAFSNYVEKLDSTWGIPRHANQQSLPAYQAFWHFSGDVMVAISTIFCGIISAVLLWVTANMLDVSFQTRLFFMMGMLFTVLIGCAEAAAVQIPYMRVYQLTTYGSARWATAIDLLAHGFLRKVSEPLKPGWIVLGRFKRKYHIVLPPAEWLRHLVFIGPTGSGKSKTFFMWLLRYVARGGSAVIVDPKPELYQQTAHHFQRVFRLDLKDPAYSDRWNFVPRCQQDPEFAHAMAAMMIGLEHAQKTNQDPFWGTAEHVACTAILMFLGTITETPTPPMVYEYTCLRDDAGFAEDMSNCENYNVKLAWRAFLKAPKQTQGSVMIGLANKLHSFFLENVQAVCAPITEKDREAGVQEIEFEALQEPGTAIYIVIPEGAALRYKAVLATFVGQGVLHLRDSDDSKYKKKGEPRTPVMFLIDEAYNIPVTEIKSVSGVGRERGIGLCLGYQDVPQLYEQYGKDGANAILGTLVTKIFLPGVDDVTAQYASRLLGQTTTLSHTTVDAPGSKYDNQRASETGRALRDPNEIRQMPKYQQALIVTDTIPPIKCAFPTIALEKDEAHPPYYGKPTILSFEQAEKAYLEKRARERAEQRNGNKAEAAACGDDRVAATGPRGGAGGRANTKATGAGRSRAAEMERDQGNLWGRHIIKEEAHDALDHASSRVTVIKKTIPPQPGAQTSVAVEEHEEDLVLNRGRTVAEVGNSVV
jgi:type IV secretion system protein VirD4